MSDMTSAVGRAVVVLVVAVLAAVVGWAALVEYPADLAELVGVLVSVLLVVGALRLGGSVAERLFPSYNVAEVAVEGMITRDRGGSRLPTGPINPGADRVVDQIERADDDGNVDALLVKLNTPGGEIVPSDDIRLAAERFDGPTVAYATDLCASGGYVIACGCDELWAREGTMVGSIGVRGSRPVFAGLLDRLDVEYEQLIAGEYKEAGSAMTAMDDDERDYLQGLIDDHYDDFVDTVAEARDLDADAVRDTEARVYLGEQATDVGLVDELGTREDVEERLADDLGRADVREFEPTPGVAERFRGGAQRVAYAAGAGLASVLVDGGGEVELP